MRRLLLATTIAASGLLPLTALAAGPSPSGSSTGQAQTGSSDTGQRGQTGSGQMGTTQPGMSGSGQMGSGQTGSTAQGSSGAMGAGSQAWESGRSIGEQEMESLAGRSVTTSQGQEIGQIESIVRGQDGQAYAVMDVGTAMGIGERQVAVPMDHLRMSDGDVLMMSPEGEQGLQSQPEYQSDRYTPYQSGGGQGITR